MSDLISVLVLGKTDNAYLERVRSRVLHDSEAGAFAITHRPDDTGLYELLASLCPQVIVTFGDARAYQQPWRSPLSVRERWIHIDDPTTDPAAVGERILSAFVLQSTAVGPAARFPDSPLVSVITPTCNPGDKIKRPHSSLLAQTYDNWEWVLVDDSPDGGETFGQLKSLCATDPRIKAYQPHQVTTNTGLNKRLACGLALGEIFVELGHDDELTADCLSMIVKAFAQFPDAGFAYTDCAEVFDDGRAATYVDGWGLGFGSYRSEMYGSRTLMVTNYPSINSKTIRHIVGVPNHVRAWKRQAYFASGGHSPFVHVCDDYELLVRTFLTTRMVHINQLGYIQHHNNQSSVNTQQSRSKEIQRLTRSYASHYDQRIHDRFAELGVSDFAWANGRMDWSTPSPIVGTEPRANYDLR